MKSRPAHCQTPASRNPAACLLLALSRSIRAASPLQLLLRLRHRLPRGRGLAGRPLCRCRRRTATVEHNMQAVTPGNTR